MDCCSIERGPKKEYRQANCPDCRNAGKPVGIITLKSLLLPDALAQLDPESNYLMCADETCEVVYFNEKGQVYRTGHVKVPVFQKTADEDCPVCYCFGWTRARIKEEILETGRSTAIESIGEHVRAGRCGCEVNNPQGSCCLANVKRVVAGYKGE